MGLTFIGNPFDQETEYDDSDWEMNAVEEWILPPQELALVEEVVRAPNNFIVPVEEESSDSYAEEESDEEYFPEESDATFDIDDGVADFRQYFFDSTQDDDDDDDDIDYVAYPIRTEEDSEPDKPTAADTSNQGESSDTD